MQFGLYVDPVTIREGAISDCFMPLDPLPLLALSQGAVIHNRTSPSLRRRGGDNEEGFIRTGLGGEEGERLCSGSKVNKNKLWRK